MRAVKVFILIIVVWLGINSGYAQKSSSRILPVVRIGVVIDGAWQRFVGIRELFREQILELTQDEYDVQFPEDKILVLDFDPVRIRAANDQLLADPAIDLILALGPIASDDICKRGDLPRPVIAPFIIDPAFQNLAIAENGGSGIRNLSYITYPADIAKDIEAFQRLASFTRLTLMSSRSLLQSLPTLSENIRNELQQKGIATTMVSVGESADEALAAIPADAEAIYLTPLTLLTPSEFDALIKGINARRLPSFSLFGRLEVELGVFASLAPAVNFERLARRVGLYTQRILNGEEPANLKVRFERREQLTINLATARAINVFPNWRAIEDADIINEERTDIDRTLSVEGSIQEAIAANRSLAAFDRRVAAGKQEINRARSVLLPQADASLTGVMIDRDRAEASFGTQAERTLTGSVGLTQVLYAEPAWANLKIQRHLQNSLEQEREQLRLDIAVSAATTYLNVLRAKSFQRIQKQNLQLSRSNLELAQIRESIGQASRAEVFRWESQIAAARIQVAEAEAVRRQAEVALNQVLHRPLEEPFLTVETGLDHPGLLTSAPRLFAYTNNLWLFEIFRDFMVQEGMAASPELQALDAAIAAQERAYASTKRAFWVPTLALQGELANVFYRGGAGTDGATGGLPPGVTFPVPNDLQWNVALNLSYPLLTGGERFADRTQAQETLLQLRLERESLAEQIEQLIRSELHQSSATFPAIRWSRESAEASQKNLELVTDAYSRGATDILQLLDAQNAALSSGLSAQTAVYDFLIDFLEIQRAIGNPNLIADAQQREQWFQRLEEYFEKRGVGEVGR